MIRLHQLAKTFGKKQAVQNLSLEVRAGEIFGLLGHNGAGKSTTFGMILGQIHPSSGEAFVNGVSVQRNRLAALKKTGAIFETPGFYDYLSGWRNLEILTSYSGGVSREEMVSVVRLVGLGSRIHERVKVYSHGMRQRLALAQALLPEPSLVLLDEPTEGLDPEGIHEIRNLILKLNRERGLTVLLSSHLLSEVEQMCDRVAILNQGRLVFNGRWAELGCQKNQFRLAVDNWGKTAECVVAFGALVLAESLIALDSQQEIADLVERLVQAGVRLSAVEPVRATLEQLYLQTIAAR